MSPMEQSGNQQETDLQNITVCPGCDLIVSTTHLEVPFGSQLVCPRCKYKIQTPRPETVHRTLVFSITALLFFFPAHFMILLHLDALGFIDQGTVYNSITALYSQKYFLVALMVLLTAILIPLTKLTLLFLVSLGIAKNLYTRYLSRLFRWYTHIEEWGMTEVYLIGIFVTIIKMSKTAAISYDAGFFCFIGLSFAIAGCIFSLDRHYYWEMIEELNRGKNQSEKSNKTESARLDLQDTALMSGIIQCHTCHKVMRHVQPEPGFELICPRCGGIVHKRIPGSISTTWALVITAVIFSFPANFLPIMQVDFLGTPDKSTIMDGIKYFFQTGSYGIGIIIFTASILVPLFKVIGLMILLYSIHFDRWSRLTNKSITFRFIEFIGRWSMLDVFVIALLCALVDFGFFTRVTAAPAATFFTFVVLATMFAAISFDPRLLWDITTPREAILKEE